MPDEEDWGTPGYYGVPEVKNKILHNKRNGDCGCGGCGCGDDDGDSDGCGCGCGDGY